MIDVLIDPTLFYVFLADEKKCVRDSLYFLTNVIPYTVIMPNKRARRGGIKQAPWACPIPMKITARRLEYVNFMPSKFG